MAVAFHVLQLQVMIGANVLVNTLQPADGSKMRRLGRIEACMNCLKAPKCLNDPLQSHFFHFPS